MKKVTVYLSAGFIMGWFLCANAMAGDKMSLKFFDNSLKIGGDFYLRTESRSDYYTQDGRTVSDHGLSSRQRLSVDYSPQKGVGIMLTLMNTTDWNDPHPSLFPYAYDHDIDIQQAYIHLEKPLNLPVSFWAGRREVAYLNQRLIGHSYGWTNKPINFDGAGVAVEGKAAKLDLFYLNKVLRDLDENASFDDDWFGDPADLFGTWLTFKGLPLVQQIDTYLLINNDDNHDDSYTTGIRIYGKKGQLDYDTNLSLQYGGKHIAGKRLDRRARAFYMDVGYMFDIPQRPRIAVQYNYASGDGDGSDGSYRSFDQLYGCVHGKYGLMDFFSWRNMHDLYFYTDAYPFKNLKMLCGVHSFWLDKTKDGWYNCYNKLQRRDPTGNARSYVGSEVDILLSYTFLTNFNAKLFYGHFFDGSYIKDTGKSADADYTYSQLEYRF
ncbi:MAG: hypothetical protein DRH37_04715 [Deltaproteobacteria bacterium]|nr:MAG: hypothetical protein DRH37_04715 [Deltaproteobacteria bacterium]